MCSLDEYWAWLRWRRDREHQVMDTMFNNVVVLAAAEGRFDVLKWWAEAEHDVSIQYEKAMGAAASAGQLAVIEWMVALLEDRGARDCTSNCDRLVDEASSLGHVHVLTWWKSSGLDLKYTHSSIDGACANGHLDVIKWWSASGLECRYTGRVVDKAAGGGHVAILRWLHEQPTTAPVYFPENDTPDAVDSASHAGHVAALQFFIDTGRPLKYTHQAMDGASSRTGYTHVLDWWLQHKDKLELKFSPQAIDPNRVTIPVLEWWRKAALGLPLDLDLGYVFTTNLTLPLLAWVRRNGYRVVVHPEKLRAVSSAGRFDLVEYFFEEMGMRPTPAVLSGLEYSGQKYVADWLRERM